MNTKNLWDKLVPNKNKENIIRDLEAGLAPNLPFFIVDATEAKAKIKESIDQMDDHLNFNFLTADYGNGKTNIMKYLKYFFELHPERNVKVELWAADVDKYNLINFLLHIINSNYIQELYKGFQKLVLEDEEVVKGLAGGYDGPASFLRGYYQKIKDSLSEENDTDEFEILIALGTGRIHNKNYFKKKELNEINDNERHFVLLFFLNVIAYSGTYIIFAIDELEKVLEKSRVRFNLMLTSYRELIDLSNQIKGHYLITAGTDAMGDSSIKNLVDYNPAFARRINPFKISLPFIDKDRDIKDLAEYLNEFINQDKTRTEAEINKIVDEAHSKSSKTITRNSDLLQFICAQLVNTSVKNWKDVLDNSKLKGVYDTSYNQIKYNQNISRLDYALMNSIEDLLAVKGLLSTMEVSARDQQTIVDKDKHKIQLFLTTDDTNVALAKIQNIRSSYPGYEFVIYRKISTDIPLDMNTEVITYDPIELMALIDMFTDNSNDKYRENIQEVISAYTNNNL